LKRPTLRALGLKSLKDIPDHIPTVRWNWVLTVIGRDTLTKEEIDAKLRDVWMHAAFSERMDAGYTPHISTSLPSFRKKGKEKAVMKTLDEGPSEVVHSCVFFIPLFYVPTQLSSETMRLLQ
jgi:DNA polymerase lambda